MPTPDTSRSAVEKFKFIPFTRRDHCVICGESVSSPIINLPAFPITEIYSRIKIKKPVGFLDQAFHFCVNCGHGQIANVIDTDFQYEEGSYFFRTSLSQTGKEASHFFLNFLDQIAPYRKFNHILDIGCNDLYILKALQARAKKLTGVDPILRNPTNKEDDSISVINDFWEKVELKTPADLIICKDTLEHVADPKSFLKKVLTAAADDALLVFQFPCLEALVEGCHFDQIFHQHLNYFTKRSIHYLLSELGCKLFQYTINMDHWGSIIIAFQKKGQPRAQGFASTDFISVENIHRKHAIFHGNLASTHARLMDIGNETLCGYGAALMLPILNYYLKNALSRLSCILDDDERKIGLCYINFPVIIKNPCQISGWKKKIIVITAVNNINSMRQVLRKALDLKPKQIIIPLNSF